MNDHAANEKERAASSPTPAPFFKILEDMLHNNDRIIQKKGIEIHETTQNIADADRIWTLRDTTNIAVDIITNTKF